MAVGHFALRSQRADHNIRLREQTDRQPAITYTAAHNQSVLRRRADLKMPSHVFSIELPMWKPQRAAVRQRDLTTVVVSAQRNIEVLLVEESQPFRRVHQHHAYTIGTAKGRF